MILICALSIIKFHFKSQLLNINKKCQVTIRQSRIRLCKKLIYQITWKFINKNFIQLIRVNKNLHESARFVFQNSIFIMLFMWLWRCSIFKSNEICQVANCQNRVRLCEKLIYQITESFINKNFIQLIWINKSLHKNFCSIFS